MGGCVTRRWGRTTATSSSPITFVGSANGAALGTGGTHNFLFSSLVDEAGGTPTLQADDLVIVNYGCATSNTDESFTPPTGYTEDQETYVNSLNTDINQCIWYKKMPGTPDTQITAIPNKVVSTQAASYNVMVFRGVNTSTALDVASTLSSNTSSAVASPAAITPATSGAMVVVCAAGGGDNTPTVYTNPGDLESDTNNFRAKTVADTSDLVVGMGFQGTLHGTFTPLSFGGGTGGTSCSCVTLALRPA